MSITPLIQLPEWRDLDDAAMRNTTLQTAILKDRTLARVDRCGMYLRWGSQLVFHSLRLVAPIVGRFIYDIERGPGDGTVGFDIEPEEGSVLIEPESAVKVLRIWDDRRFLSHGSYRFQSKGTLRVWNVYKTLLPQGKYRDEKWTGNAAFTVETLAPDAIRLHCSPGFVSEPDFEHLIVRLRLAYD